MEEAYGVWRKNGLRPAGCPVGRGRAESCGPGRGSRGGPGEPRWGRHRWRAWARSEAELVAVSGVWKGFGRVTAMDKCVESKVVHLLSKPLRGVMAKGGLWWRNGKDRNPLPSAFYYRCFTG